MQVVVAGLALTGKRFIIHFEMPTSFLQGEVSRNMNGGECRMSVDELASLLYKPVYFSERIIN